MSRCDNDGNGKHYLTSEETTPILEERKPIKLDRSSPLLKGVSWTPRSRSTDNLEKCSPVIGRKSPLVKMQTEPNSMTHPSTLTHPSSSIGGGGGGDSKSGERLTTPTTNDSKTRSPSNDSLKSNFEIEQHSMKTTSTNGIVRTPLMAPKPRPWSVAGNEGKCDFSADLTKTTPEAIDTGDVVLIEGQGGGSIVGITPGAALGCGGSIVGITPGLSYFFFFNCWYFNDIHNSFRCCVREKIICTRYGSWIKSIRR